MDHGGYMRNGSGAPYLPNSVYMNDLSNLASDLQQPSYEKQVKLSNIIYKYIFTNSHCLILAVGFKMDALSSDQKLWIILRFSSFSLLNQFIYATPIY